MDMKSFSKNLNNCAKFDGYRYVCKVENLMTEFDLMISDFIPDSC